MIDRAIEFLSSGENIAFMFFAVLVFGGAVWMITFTRVVHMVIALSFTFLSLAGLYILLEAEFVAFVQVLIYAGAITILMIFGIMMTKHGDAEEIQPLKLLHHILLLLGTLGFLGIIAYAVSQANFPQPAPFDAGEDNTRAIGEALFTQHVIPFELVSVLLTVAFIGAIILAKKEEE